MAGASSQCEPDSDTFEVSSSLPSTALHGFGGATWSHRSPEASDSSLARARFQGSIKTRQTELRLGPYSILQSAASRESVNRPLMRVATSSCSHCPR